MVTLNDLLELAEVKRITLYAPATPRVDTRIDFNTTDSAVLCDVLEMYGDCRVLRIGPIFKGDDRLIVRLGSERRIREEDEETTSSDPTEPGHLPLKGKAKEVKRDG